MKRSKNISKEQDLHLFMNNYENILIIIISTFDISNIGIPVRYMLAKCLNIFRVSNSKGGGIRNVRACDLRNRNSGNICCGTRLLKAKSPKVSLRLDKGDRTWSLGKTRK